MTTPKKQAAPKKPPEPSEAQRLIEALELGIATLSEEELRGFMTGVINTWRALQPPTTETTP